MSESKHPCPICARPVGGVHEDSCPRSKARQVLLQRARTLERMARTRNLIWTSAKLVRKNDGRWFRVLVQGTRRHGQRNGPHGTFVQAMLNLLKAAAGRLEGEDGRPVPAE